MIHKIRESFLKKYFFIIFWTFNKELDMITKILIETSIFLHLKYILNINNDVRTKRKFKIFNPNFSNII